VDVPGQTLTATRFAELTGVSRERLRAWERRYGFPQPVRIANGPRRYPVADVQRVVAIRRAAQEGTPIAAAIERTRDAPGPATAPEAFQVALENAPFPVALISGPEPLRLQWANAAVRAQPGAPSPGDELLAGAPRLAGSRAGTLLREQFARELPVVECEHPRWDGSHTPTMRSALYRVPARAGEQPLVAMVGLETRREQDVRRALAAAEAELEGLRRRSARHERWLDAAAGLSEAFQHEPGPRVIDTALDVLIRQTGAVDCAMAAYVSGELMVTRSRRDLLEPRMITAAAHPALVRAIRDSESFWLDETVAAQVGVPRGLSASGIPVVVAGETLGLLITLFDAVEPHDADNGRLLATISAGLGFALLRDRLVRELRSSAAPEDGDGHPPMGD
jgi:DNA-binding transcriptional MerR regulator